MCNQLYWTVFCVCEVERKKRERDEDYKIADVMTKEVSLQFSLFFNDKCIFKILNNVYFFYSFRKFCQKPKNLNWKR